MHHLLGQSLFRTGTVRPFGIMTKDETGQFVGLFISKGNITVVVDVDAASEFVCWMYAQSKTRHVNEARYNRLTDMTGQPYQVNLNGLKIC